MKYNIIEENEHPVKKKRERWVHIIYEIFIVDENKENKKNDSFLGKRSLRYEGSNKINILFLGAFLYIFLI